MALFSRKNKKEADKSVVAPAVLKSAVTLSSRGSVIISARVTEKATKESEQNVYTFNVTPSATKTEIKEAVKRLYNVSPLKVAIVTVRPKALFQKGKRGRSASGRKAYVMLPKGQQIEFI